MPSWTSCSRPSGLGFTTETTTMHFLVYAYRGLGQCVQAGREKLRRQQPPTLYRGSRLHLWPRPLPDGRGENPGGYTPTQRCNTPMAPGRWKLSSWTRFGNPQVKVQQASASCSFIYGSSRQAEEAQQAQKDPGPEVPIGGLPTDVTLPGCDKIPIGPWQDFM